MTEILSADSPTKPKPLTKLVAHLRAHPFIIAGTLFCVAVLVFEWLTYWPDLNGFETALSTLIPVLTLGVAIMPVPFSLSIIVVEVLRGIFYIFPVVHSGPTVYYSVWLALIVIGYEMPAKYAIPITVIAALDTMVDNAIFQVPFDANDIGFAATFLLDGFAGLAIRRNKEFARLRYEQREQAKQIHLVRTRCARRWRQSRKPWNPRLQICAPISSRHFPHPHRHPRRYPVTWMSRRPPAAALAYARTCSGSRHCWNKRDSTARFMCLARRQTNPRTS